MVSFASRVSGVTAWSLAVACSLAVDTSELDEGCGPDRKLCGGQCVLIADPAFGCDPVDCDPCRSDNLNVIPRCDAGMCEYDTCVFPYGCDNCATNLLTNALRCGDCNTSCTRDQTCSLGVCVPPPPSTTPEE